MVCSVCHWLPKKRKIRIGKLKIVLIMNSKIAQKLSSKQFKRPEGVHRATFKQLVKAHKPAWRQTPRLLSSTQVKVGGAGADLLGILARISHLFPSWQQLGSE